MKLSVIIPAKNEEGNVADTIKEINSILSKNNIQHEIIVINDNSTDSTLEILKYLKAGCGFGGSCFPKDIKAIGRLGKNKGLDMKIVDSVIEINNKNMCYLSYNDKLFLFTATLEKNGKPCKRRAL